MNVLVYDVDERLRSEVDGWVGDDGGIDGFLEGDFEGEEVFGGRMVLDEGKAVVENGCAQLFENPVYSSVVP